MIRDVGVTVALHDRLPAWASGPVSSLSVLGQPFAIVPALGSLYLADVIGTLRRDDCEPGEPLCSDRTAFIVATVLGGMAFGAALKSAFGMARPPEDLHAVEESEYGFPSGHTLAATVFWGAIALWTSAGRRSARLAAAGLIVAAVAVSRMALGVHYAVDVLASVVLGAAYLATVAWLTDGRPGRAFCVAVGVGLFAALTSRGNDRSRLATAGTVTAAIGWRVSELRPVRRALVRVASR